MKNLITLALGGVLSLALLGNWAQAQNTGTTTPTDPATGTTVERPVLRNLPADVRDMIKAMQDARNAFLAQQKATLAELKGQDRATIREALRTNLDAFLEKQKPVREELRTRLAELRKDFVANHQKLVDELKAKVGTRVRKGD